MASIIPLIRAGAIMPMVHWMRNNGRQVETALSQVDLGYVLRNGPDLAIPLGQAIEFLRISSRSEGPDFACRVVSRSSVRELGLIGTVALNSGSVREALSRVAVSLPLHVTHGLISVNSVSDGIAVREAWSMRMDEECRHLVQQYVAALIQALCVNAGAELPVFGRVRLVPHPVYGLRHLYDCFGERVLASADKVLELFVPSSVADRPLPRGGTEESSFGLGDAEPLRGDGTLRYSAALVVASMMTDRTPTVEQLAAASGLSRRTLQRRLRDEGTSFSGLLDALRCDLALAGIAAGDRRVSEIAGLLRYGQQSSLTRAVRRWTGTPPRTLGRG